MGVTITCWKSGKGIDMGYGGFNRLRNRIGTLAGEPFASHLAKLSQEPYMFGASWMTADEKKALFDAFDAETERMLAEGLVSIAIADFCLQPDTGGKIPYKSCKELLKVIGDYDDDIIYGYAGRNNPAKFADFKAILQDCIDNKCMMVWG